jgi:hypothetical protein
MEKKLNGFFKNDKLQSANISIFKSNERNVHDADPRRVQSEETGQ